MARGEASHAGTASVLGSDEPHVRPACSAIIAAVTRCYVTPIIEQAAHRPANECFAGPQTASSATPTHPPYRIVVLFMESGWKFIQLILIYRSEITLSGVPAPGYVR